MEIVRVATLLKSKSLLPFLCQVSVAECVLWSCLAESPDPAGSITGYRLHTAALLHDHVYVGFHDLGDLSNLRGFKEHFSLVHSDLVGAGLWSTKEDDVFIRKGLQRLWLPSFVDGHILSAHA